MGSDHDCCRSCMSESPRQYVKMSDTPFGEQTLYSEMFKDCTDIDVEQDNLSKMLCLSCSNALKFAFEFRRQSRKTHETLMKNIIPKTDVLAIKTEKPSEHSNLLEVMLTEERGVTVKEENDQADYFEDSWVPDTAPEVEMTVVEKTGSLRCDICNKEFPKPSQLRAHFHKIHKEIQCTFCSEVIIGKYQLDKHERLVHQIVRQEEKYQMQDAQDMTVSDGKYKWKGFYCYAYGCRELFNSANGLAQHLQELEGDANHMPHCELCGKNFHKRGQMRVHINHFHKEVECSQCSTVLNGQYRLEKHEKNVHGVTNNVSTACPICNRVYKSRRCMLIHKNYKHSTKEQSCPCEICGKVMGCKSSLKSHIKLVHNDNSRPFPCEQCGKSFKTRGALNTHIPTHSVVNTVTCDICGIKLKNPFYLHAHKKLHSDKYEIACEICGGVFKNWSYLKSHLNTHAEHKGVQCKICLKTYKSEKLCKKHVETIHREPTFKCDQCNKGYTKASMLRDHIISEHEKRRIWECKYEGCEKAYYRRAHLNHHVKVIHLNHVKKGAKEPTAL